MKANRFKTKDYPNELSSWACMITRCTNPRFIHFKHYGGRGITVCDRWRVFSNFVEDMGRRPAGHSLDRIDTNGNYEPGNCKWSSPKEQMNNVRKNRRVFFRGKKMTIAEISGLVGLPYDKVRACIKGFPDTFESRIDEGFVMEDTKTRKKLIKIDGRIRSQKEWSEHLGINYFTIKSKAFRNSTTVEALVRSIYEERRP